MCPGFTHCVAGRFMPFGAGPACSWTRFYRRLRMARLEFMNASSERNQDWKPTFEREG